MGNSTKTSLNQQVDSKSGFLHKDVGVVGWIILLLLLGLFVYLYANTPRGGSRMAKASTLKGNLQIIRNAIAAYEADMGSYPSDLKSLYDSSGIKQRKHWKGPYLKKEGSVIGDTAIPVNPYAKSSTVTDHWTYSAATGTIVPNTINTPGNDPRGKPYSQY